MAIKKNVPELRFPEFSGEWEEKKLNKITGRIGDGIHSTPNYNTEGEIAFINGNNIKDKKIILDNNTKRITLEEFSKYKQALSQHTILLSINGTIGNIGLYNQEDVLLGKSISYINPNIEIINRIFLMNYLNSYNVKRYFSNELTGTTIRNLSLATIRATLVKMPHLPEQTKIANFFTLIDKKIEKQQEKVTNLEDYKKGMMQKIFSQEIRFKDENGEDYPGWEEKKLGDMGSFSRGSLISKGDITETGKSCILYGELFTIYGEVINDIYSKTNIETSNLVYSKQNDLLFPSSTTVDAISLISPSSLKLGGVIIGGDINIFRPNKDVSSDFLSYYINGSEKKDIAKLAQGTTIIHIYNQQLKVVYINIPSLPEQIKIANFLSSIDLKISKEKEKLDTIKELKKGLMQKMFI